jgi:hypothetical protein
VVETNAGPPLPSGRARRPSVARSVRFAGGCLRRGKRRRGRLWVLGALGTERPVFVDEGGANTAAG